MVLTEQQSLRIRVLADQYEQAAVVLARADDSYRRAAAEFKDYVRSLESKVSA